MNCCNNPPVPPSNTPGNPCCPTQFCDSRLRDLPQRKEFRLAGVEGDCLVQFPKNAPGGVVIVDQWGRAIVTQRPRIPLPYQREIVVEGGQPVMLPGGGFMEGPPPPFDSFVISNCEGDQNRIRGTAGRPQRIHWDGCKFIFVDDMADLTLEQFQYVGTSHGYCGTYEVVLVDQGDGTVKMGYRPKPSIPPGVTMLWCAPKELIPAGYIICEGQPLSKAAYTDLFPAWGYTWGGSADTFYAPKANGRYARFVDDGAGVDPHAASRTQLHAGGQTGDNVGSYGKGANATTDDYDFYVYLIAFAGCVKSV